MDLLNQKNTNNQNDGDYAQRSLFERFSSYEHLYHSFKDCSLGKRSKAGFQKFHLHHGEKLKKLEIELRTTQNYQWNGYRKFYVHDPKKRMIMAAPFKDRVIHMALYKILNEIIDPILGAHTFACRIGKGNSHAVTRLFSQLKLMGENRYCLKLDVKKYFQSIDHHLLMKNLFNVLPDQSLHHLLEGLIHSPCTSSSASLIGIPIGNLTSQLFANFYLSSADKLACQKLGLDYCSSELKKESFYIRYMDDIIILSNNKERAFMAANALIEFLAVSLKLEIPSYKKIILAKDPIPFLGFVIDHETYRPLQRNKRRFAKKIKRLEASKALPSHMAQVKQSYESWKIL